MKLSYLSVLLGVACFADGAQELYLTPGGEYTAEDIVANGSTTPWEKCKGFSKKPNIAIAAGDLVCPVTGTKAHPDCSWIIGGKRYYFCCPDCIEEFLIKAKN